MEKLFDSHAHYYDERFIAEGEGAIPLLEQLFASNVGGILNVGTSLENAKQVLEQAAAFPFMYAALGIHPSDGQAYEKAELAVEQLAELIGTAEQRRERKIVALGEIGLDYHYPDTDKPHQAKMLALQLSLARELDLPVIIHDRDAHGDCFDAVCACPGIRGVFHSYSGSAEMARDLVRRGWYISFSGVATFKNAPRVREAIAAVPIERILIETDAPYLAPHPHRGKLNHSGYLCYTAAAVGEVKGLSSDEVAWHTARNAAELFGLS